MSDEKELPSAKSLLGSSGAYNQTYIIMSDELDGNNESKSSADGHEVFFRCGNWCYRGRIQFNGLKISTSDLPVIIPTLQRQQGSLRYYCNSNSIPPTSDYSDPLKFLSNATDFVASEMISESVDKELRKMASVFPWIDDDAATTYFELVLGDVPECMHKVGLVATKTYCRGLILISVYYECTMYFIIQGGEGDQPLLDVRFPDISKHGQGLHIASYVDPSLPWRKLTLWHVLNAEVQPIVREIPKLKTISVSSKNYDQTYCIMKSAWDAGAPTLSVHHDVLFRFGSWCYSGRVQLTPSLTLADIPFVIPALRMQQSRLDYICDAASIPTTSPFAAALDYVRQISPIIDQQIVESEETLNSLIERLSRMGLGESVSRWLEGDPSNSFFEFKLSADNATLEAFKGLELVASKAYHASGIITITIVFQNTVYVSVLDGSHENPLLDSRFPDVSGKGRGYQIQAYNDGIKGWSSLRKVSIWQTVGALEQEFRERAAQLAQSKQKENISMEQNKDLDSEMNELTIVSDPDIESPCIAEEKSINNINNNNNNNNMQNKSLSSPAKGELIVAEVNISSPDLASEKLTQSCAIDSKEDQLRRSPAVSRPHHIPKMESLSKKMEELRKTLGTEDGISAPWDANGKPMKNNLQKPNLLKK